MLILAIEQSSVQASVALLDNAHVLAAERWHSEWNRTQNVFEILPSLLKNASVRAEDIDLFAAGTGPGSFSGSRVAVSAVQALALPGEKRLGINPNDNHTAASFGREHWLPLFACFTAGPHGHSDRKWYISFNLQK